MAVVIPQSRPRGRAPPHPNPQLLACSPREHSTQAADAQSTSICPGSTFLANGLENTCRASPYISFLPVHTFSWTVLSWPRPRNRPSERARGIRTGAANSVYFSRCPPGPGRGAQGLRPMPQLLASVLTFVGRLGEESRSQKRRHLAKTMGAATQSRSS